MGKLAKLILKRSMSSFRVKSPIKIGNVLDSLKKVQGESLGTDLGYHKSNLEIQGGKREMYQCDKCGYITRYSHMIKMHIKCHSYGKHKEKKKKCSSSNHIYSMNKIDEHENKRS